MSPSKHYLEVELNDKVRADTEIWQFIREASLDGVWYWDLEEPENEYMDARFWELFGVDPATKKHLAAEWQDLIFPEDLELAKANLDAHLADPSHPYDQVVRYRHADGSTVWVRCRGMAVRDETGKPIRLLGAHNDLTQQMMQQRKASSAEAEMASVLEAASSGIVAFGSDGKIHRINNKARHILGGLLDEVPFNWPENVVFIDAETMQPLDSSADPIKRALSGNTVAQQTFLMRRIQPGQDHRYVRIKWGDLDPDESEIRLVVIIDDVSSEERNRQVVERKSRLDALGQVTGGIAHDFNNLLSALLYGAELMGRTKDEKLRSTYSKSVRNSINRGRELTSRLLTFASRQPGLSSAKQTSGVLNEFLKLVRPMIEANIELEHSTEDESLVHYCDAVQLETALMNLVLNARDAIIRSGQGNKIDIKVRGVRAVDKELEERQVSPQQYEVDEGDDSSSYRFVEISVTDNGPGMDPETLARCTDPFFTTKDSNSGTGLGLATVYGFSRQADGSLDIYSELGQGTTFKLTLPRGTAEGKREERLPEEDVPTGNGETIFIVEDERELRFMLRELLKELGYKVIEAISGEDAIASIKSGTEFDVLLTDVVMQGSIGGFELARLMREVRPDLPVIYTSGYTGFTASEMGEVQAPVLQKPVSREVLADILSQALAKK